MKDLTNPAWIKAKGFLFLVLGLSSATLLFFERPSLRVAALLLLVVWSFCRFYYFASTSWNDMWILRIVSPASSRLLPICLVSSAAGLRRQGSVDFQFPNSNLLHFLCHPPYFPPPGNPVRRRSFPRSLVAPGCTPRFGLEESRSRHGPQVCPRKTSQFSWRLAHPYPPHGSELMAVGSGGHHANGRIRGTYGSLLVAAPQFLRCH